MNEISRALLGLAIVISICAVAKQIGSMNDTLINIERQLNVKKGSDDE